MTPELDRAKLARILGLLGSAHDGEVAAAGRAAHTMVRAASVTWFDILDPPPRGSSSADHFATVDFCLLWPNALTGWELTFLRSLRRRSRISDRQRALVDEIAAKVDRHVAATRAA